MKPKTFRVEQVLLNDQKYEYELWVGGVKRLNLRIRPDGSIRVSTPLWVGAASREHFLQSNASNIVRAVARARRRTREKEAEEAYENGGRVRYLGRELVLRVVPALPGQRRKAVCTLDDEQQPTALIVTVQHQPNEMDTLSLVKKAINEWEKERLLSWIQIYHQNTVVALFAEVMRQRGSQLNTFVLHPTDIRIRDMKSRWGSCHTQTGALTFHRRLIRFPEACIEYVVVHEFAHFLQPDHSPAFHALMSVLLPDWKQRRENLNTL